VALQYLELKIKLLKLLLGYILKIGIYASDTYFIYLTYFSFFVTPNAYRLAAYWSQDCVISYI